MQVEQPREVLVDRRAVLGMPLGKLAQSTGFVGLVVDEDGTQAVRMDRLERAFDAGYGRVVAAEIQKFHMLEDARGTFDVAGPLKRDLLIGAHACATRDWEDDAPAIKVIARVG